MKAFIDGDVIVYRAGFTTNDVEKPRLVASRIRTMMRTIDQGLFNLYGETDYEIWLSDSKDNFRLQLFPKYKANRVIEKPRWHLFIQNLLVEEWGALVAFGEEADDAMSMRQHSCRKEGVDSVICSVDKDLLQVPGKHWNWVTNSEQTVSELSALLRFYMQILTGDNTDNICVATGLSCKAIGARKAVKAIEGYNKEAEMFQRVYELYHLNWGHEFPKAVIDNKLLTTGRLVKLRTYPGELWEFPVEPDYNKVLELREIINGRLQDNKKERWFSEGGDDIDTGGDEVHA